MEVLQEQHGKAQEQTGDGEGRPENSGPVLSLKAELDRDPHWWRAHQGFFHAKPSFFPRDSERRRGELIAGVSAGAPFDCDKMTVTRW